ncbi:EPIDERMAL PATTERNING FACTOR-like protein 8 [Morella rubra]|uniref:Epidermal patterning factor-like protein n=1 Tax=Morella rubra TaxID=262757 RepID=A0A6A1W6B1_9ROSI|nr:EPIDERMAL PATTERNING FACTOR-like protein 8 [Morella rubra]
MLSLFLRSCAMEFLHIYLCWNKKEIDDLEEGAASRTYMGTESCSHCGFHLFSHVATSQIRQRREFRGKENGVTVLGSKPPGCVNRCLNCRPCIATLVIPSHQMKEFSASSCGEDDSYYLLSWKCRCGNKLFQP